MSEFWLDKEINTLTSNNNYHPIKALIHISVMGTHKDAIKIKVENVNDGSVIQKTNNRINTLDQAVSSRLFRVQSLDEAHEHIANILCPHKIDVVDNEDRLDVDFRGVQRNDLSLLNINYGAHVDIQPVGNDEFYFAQTTLAGSTCVYDNHQIVPTRAGETVVVSPHNDYKFNLPTGASRLVIGIQNEVLEQYLSSILHEPVKDNLLFQMESVDQAAQQMWVNHVINLSRMLTTQPIMATNNKVFQSHLEATMSLMLTLFRHNYSENLNSPKDTTTTKRIEKAKEFIHANIHNNITVHDVANAACVSPRALQYSFRDCVGISPSKYIRHIKLDAVRKALLKASPEENVTNILSDFGITSFGHFSKFYKSSFGCTPKITLMKKDSY